MALILLLLALRLEWALFPVIHLAASSGTSSDGSMLMLHRYAIELFLWSLGVLSTSKGHVHHDRVKDGHMSHRYSTQPFILNLPMAMLNTDYN